jgi:hypothetical protein
MPGKLCRDLVARVDGEVRFDEGARAAYAHDAVVRPRDDVPGLGPEFRSQDAEPYRVA